MSGTPAARRPPQRLLIIARSARALAASARRAGYPCDVIDQFADADTRALADFCRVAAQLTPATLEPLLAEWRDRVAGNAAQIVVGSGVEAQPALVDWLAGHAPVAANSAATLARLKQPRKLAALLGELAIQHPAIVTAAHAAVEPANDWLVKQAAGDGGGHVRSWQPPGTLGPAEYLQRRCPGRPASAVFLADGRGARLVGYNHCLRAAAQTGDNDDYRFAGAIAAPWPASLAAAIATAVDRLVAATGLRGLCGIDLLVDETAGTFVLLEVNPRPPASFELHEQGGSLVAAHLAACGGRLPADWPATGDCPGKLVVYTGNTLQVPGDSVWPDWSADRPPVASRLEAGTPLCTVFARAATPAACEQALYERRDRLLKDIKNNLKDTDLKYINKETKA